MVVIRRGNCVDNSHTARSATALNQASQVSLRRLTAGRAAANILARDLVDARRCSISQTGKLKS